MELLITMHMRYLGDILSAGFWFTTCIYCQIFGRKVQKHNPKFSTIYSLIAQKDNLITTRIAEYSLEENQNMKIIAEANTRDSAAMVAISIVTMVFLPGTFVSSLFSTTIFDFQSDNGMVVKNHWHGIYWAITAPVTLAILCGAFVFWKLRYSIDKKMRKQRATMPMSRAHTMVRFDTSDASAGALAEKKGDP